VRRPLRRRRLIGLAVLVGCSARVDPFADDRQWVPTASAPHHVALAVSPPLLSELAQSALPAEPLVAQGPLGMPIEITPVLRGLEVRVSEWDPCLTCVDLDVEAAGQLHLRSPLLDAPAIPWQAQLSAPVRLETTHADPLLEVEAQWAEVPVQTDVQLQQLSPALEAIASGFIASWVQTLLTDALREPTPIATLKNTDIPLMSLSPVPDDRIHLQAHLAIPTEVEAAPLAPEVGEGWVLATPLSVVTALARHHAMADSGRAYFIEPTVIELDGATLRAQIRVWRRGRKAHYKAVLVEGIVSVREGTVVIAPTHADTFASMNWRGGLDTAILGAKLKRWVERGEVRVPARLSTPWGEIRVKRVVGEGGQVHLYGGFTPREPR